MWEEVNGEHHEMEKRVLHTGQESGYVMGPIFPLMGPIATNFGSMNSSWPKTDYTYPLWRLCDGVEEKQEKHETDLKSARMGGEMLPELLPVAPLTPSTLSP
jgi:hypothetical protein